MVTKSLWFRALIALALMIGFYTFSIVIALVLLAIPVVEWHATHGIHLQLALFCIVGAAVILFSIIPRPDRFVAPGPRLEPEEHPELFAVLRDVAAGVGQDMPSDVYLLHDMNAWVAERGGFFGAGSRRIMGLGSPLLRTLSVSQLRAVLAHEFGHFHGGDTKLGPWIHKTRATIILTVTSLHGHSRLLRALFGGYAKLFLRVSHAVSRAQEFAADRLAAVTVGAQPLIDGLTITQRLAPAQSAYWDQEVLPVLQAGFLPDLDEGFHRYMDSPSVQADLALMSGARSSKHTNPYDTHPSLHARVEAVRDLCANPVGHTDNRLSIDLLNPEFDVTTRLLEALGGPEFMASAVRIAWEDVPAKVHEPSWRLAAEQITPLLHDITFGGLHETMKDPETIAARFVDATPSQLSYEDAMEICRQTIGVATSVNLLDRGGVVRAGLGTPDVITLNGAEIRPFLFTRELALGELRAEKWRSLCEQMRISDVHLGER